MNVAIGERNLVPHRELLTSLLPPGVTVEWFPDDLSDVEVYVGGRFPAESASAASKLRLVHVAGAGTDNVAFPALGPDTLVANTFHHEDSIAEYVAATAVLLRRGLLTQDRALRDDVWASSVYDATLPQVRTLRGAVVGFVGFGHIGQRSWELLRAFGCVGRAVTGRGNVDADAHALDWTGDTSSLPRLLGESEVVVLSAPLTDATRGLLGARELALLGSSGVLINVGRGPLVVEDALYEALAARTLGAAALDVWYSYPGPDGRGAPSSLPFAALPNALLTPHVSGVTRDTFVGRVRDIADNIARLDRGEPLLRVVAPPR